MLPDSFHRNLRRITKHYPSPHGAALFSRIAGAIERPHRDRWLVIEPCGSAPPMELNLANALQRKIYYFTPYYASDYLEGPLAALMRRCLKSGDVVLDIGANLGWFSYLAAELVGPIGAVIAFEPNPEHHECIGRTRDLNALQQLSAEAIALANEEGAATFYLDHGGTRSSLVGGGTRGSLANVRVASLDSLVAKGEIELQRLDFVKIDVEGAEVDTVAGMAATLKRFLPVVWCEVRGDRGSSRAPGTLARVEAQLRNLGYAPSKFDGLRQRPLSEHDRLAKGAQDVLFTVAGAEV